MIGLKFQAWWFTLIFSRHGVEAETSLLGARPGLSSKDWQNHGHICDIL